MRKLLFVLMFMGQFGTFSVVNAADYSGTYSMNTGNATLTLKLNQQRNGTLTGELVGRNGYRITLNGEVTDGIGEGTASDSKGSAFFEVRFENGRLLFYLMEQNSDKGRSFYFTRVSGGVSTGNAEGSTQVTLPSRNPLAGGGSSSPFAGSFAGDGVTLFLKQAGSDLSGHLVFQGSRFPLSATASGNTIQGNFSASGNSFPFTALLTGSTMKFSTGGTTYSLRKTGSGTKTQALTANPLQRQIPSHRAAPQRTTSQPTATAMNGKTISDSQAGVTFTVPSGWTATQNEDGYLLVSKVHKGLIVVTSNAYHSLQELQTGGAEGIVNEKTGVQLMPFSQNEQIGSNGLGAVFSGQVNGQAARAYVAGLISPYPSAVGVTIIALTSEAAYDNQYPAWAKSIAASVRFSKPEIDRALMAWFSAKYWYYSGSSSQYGGISHDKNWVFCPNGTFQYYGEDSASVTGTYGSASKVERHGMWTIRGNKKKGTVFLHFIKPASFGDRELEYVATGKGQDMAFEGTVFHWASRANCQ